MKKYLVGYQAGWILENKEDICNEDEIEIFEDLEPGDFEYFYFNYRKELSISFERKFPQRRRRSKGKKNY